MISTQLDQAGTYVGRVCRPGRGPSVVTVRRGDVIDLSSRKVSTVSALPEKDDLPGLLADMTGDTICTIADLEAGSLAADRSEDHLHLLAPCDLQAFKAAGVTLTRSMIERVIEERADGDLTRAAAIRDRVSEVIDGSIADLVAGSERAAQVKEVLIAEGFWSQYLEVGSGSIQKSLPKHNRCRRWGGARGSACIRCQIATIPSPRSCSPFRPGRRCKGPHWSMTSICAMTETVLNSVRWRFGDAIGKRSSNTMARWLFTARHSCAPRAGRRGTGPPRSGPVASSVPVPGIWPPNCGPPPRSVQLLLPRRPRPRWGCPRRRGCARR